MRPPPRHTGPPAHRTYTPTPDHPLIPGIEIPVGAGGVTMLFTRARFGTTYHFQDGMIRNSWPTAPFFQRFLIVNGVYTGKEFSALFAKGGAYYHSGGCKGANAILYVQGTRIMPDDTLDTSCWTFFEIYAEGAFTIIFILSVADKGPFTLFDVAHEWQVDLTPLLNAGQATPTPTARHTITPTWTALPTNTP